MKGSVFSASWYRVSKLRPRLRSHAQIHRHHYRDELWYVLQDHATGRFYRFAPVAYQVIGLMDGKLTVHELWEKAVERFGDEAPTQGEVVHLLSQLHSADALVCNVTPDTEELFHRHVKIARGRWKQSLMSPLFLRFPLLDPERFLNRTIRFVRPLATVYGAILWILVVGSAVLLASHHWSELTENVVDRVLSAENLVVIALLFPMVKALHELGHAYAVKNWGGEVHEMGIMLLVFMPVPYVDASAASAFRERRRRVIVSAAGIVVELFVAALALHLWLNMEEGYVRSILYNVIFLASVSTVLFNGNPLLRYDGYYILSDCLEIQNLAQRGFNYLGYLFKRHLFGVKNVEIPHIGPGERFWFVFYSVASFLYRISVYAAIILFVAKKFFVIGFLLAVWAFINMGVVPVFRRLHFVMFSPVLRERRTRALAITMLLLVSVVTVLFFVPFPWWTRVEGVVWVPEESLVRAETSGSVIGIEARSNTLVEKDDVLIECRDPLLTANAKILQAQLGELEALYERELVENRVRAEITKEEIAHVRAKLERAHERLAKLTIRSPGSGVFILPGAEDLPGRFVQQGDLLAYVLNVEKPTVRVVVPQSKLDIVRHRTERVDVCLAEHLGESIPAILGREIPGGMERLPSTILGSAGGGEIAIDPWDAEGLRTFERVFQFDVELTQPILDVKVGGRVYVRFDHGFEPLGLQWYRGVRQLFLRRFNV